MEMTPKVSFIVPLYNVESYLHDCLDSIVAQTFTDFEAVLVDDGSTDNSGRICDEYSERDSRFVVIHKKNEGIINARITGFHKSKGELIAFIDSDDYISPEYLEKLVRPIVEDGVDIVSCDYYEVVEGQLKERVGKLTGVYDRHGIDDFMAHHYFFDKSCKNYGMTQFLWTKLMKREFVEEGLENSRGLILVDDQITFFTVLSNVNSMCLLPDRLYFYVQHSSQTIRKYSFDIWGANVKMFEKYRDLLDKRHIVTEGLRIRTWINFEYTIYFKMIPNRIDMSTFADHISKVRETSYMKDFFKPLSLPMGIKDNVKYWLIKLRCYRLYFFLKTKKIV